MFKNLLLSFVLLIGCTSTMAEEIKKEEKEPNYLLGAVIVEALFVANSWMASNSPNEYGGLSALLFPAAGFGEDVGDLTFWSSLVAAESLAIYNLTLDEEKYSKSEIFKNNMIAWHVFSGLVVAASFVESKWFNDKTVQFIPAKDGGYIAFNYQF